MRVRDEDLGDAGGPDLRPLHLHLLTYVCVVMEMRCVYMNFGSGMYSGTT